MSTVWTYNPQPPRPDWGVRAPALKKQSLRRPIGTVPAPAEATVSLQIGAGLELPATVAPGERVQTGQPIARGSDGATAHAPITGTVMSVGPRRLPSAGNRPGPCVVIRAEGPEKMHESCVPVNEDLLSPEEIRARVAAGGIVGLGGALFPTARKLAPGAPIRALIIDGAECEPWITCDEALLRERASMVIEGASIMMRALGTEHTVIAVEADMPEARVALDRALRAADGGDIGIAVVTTKYPAGGERQLIELLTGEEVPAGGLPRDIGYVCQNVGTAAAVGDLFRTGRPLISRIVTVTGGGIAEPGNFEVRIGTPICELVRAAGGYRNTPQRLLMGGPMMGLALPDDELPVTKATNCIVAALQADLAPAKPEMPCIRCGECVQACPARLLPHELLTAVRRNDARRLAELGLRDCIECGCCDYVCPSYIQLTARFIAAKTSGGETSPGRGGQS